MIGQLADGGTTILLTTHYLDEAEALADRVGVIVDGRLVAAGPPAELGGRSQREAVVSWIGPSGPEVVHTETPTAVLRELAGRFDGEIPGLTVQRPTLEDVYLSMLGDAERARGPAVTMALGLRQAATEIKQFMRSREQVVFTMAFPVIMVVIFGSIFTGTLPGGVRFTQYFVTGMIASGLMATGFQALAIQIPIERDRGVLKRLRGTPMPRSVYFIGKTGMVLAIAVAETVILLAVGVALFDLNLPDTTARWATFAWVGLLGVAACTLCGIAFSSLARTGRSAPAVVTPIALVLQFISGVFFVFTELPPWMQQVAALFPLKWMCQGLRSVFLPDSFAAFEPAGSWELGGWPWSWPPGSWSRLILCLTTFRWTTKRDG